MSLTYAAAGVDHDALDVYKRECQQAGVLTEFLVRRFGFSVVEASRGESVFVIKTPIGYFGMVIEGLGTKSLVADLYFIAQQLEGTKKSYYDNIGQCNAAMAFNDMITLGMLPMAYGQYLALQNADWLEDEVRRRDLVRGTCHACIQARCAWGCGETPALQGIIVKDAVDLAGATIGFCPNGRLFDARRIQEGDIIVLVESSGIHANGLSMARKIGSSMRGAYNMRLSDGRTYGETLLDPTHIYVDLVEDCLNINTEIHYAVNITGHGWRKLMRAPQAFRYIIDELPTPLPIFEFIQKHGPVDDREAYATLNMGAGFALYVPNMKNAERVIHVANKLGKRAFVGGRIEKGERKVVIKPKNLVYEAETLGVR